MDDLLGNFETVSLLPMGSVDCLCLTSMDAISGYYYTVS
jgi:hypothetical protein